MKKRKRLLPISPPHQNLMATVAKFGEQSPNEDSAYVDERCLVLSDGAGGCGLYADKWSKYLVEQLDKEKPIQSYQQLDEWIDKIWEPFYNQYEAMAKESDAMLLNKFYNEGSCATIVAAWLENHQRCHWIAYGDSVLFHYQKESGKLWHSFSKLADFATPPHLINCKDPLIEDAFKHGEFEIREDSILFAASDSLSFFILMMYQVSKWEKFQDELEALIDGHGSDGQIVEMAKNMQMDFMEDVLQPLIRSAHSNKKFAHLIRIWYDLGLMELDDYTIAFLKQ